MHAAVGIGQRIEDHVVDHLHIAHLAAAAHLTGNQIGGAGHDLRAACGDEVCLAGSNGGCSIHHGLHTGAADHIQAVGGNGIRNACTNGNLTAGALTQTGGKHITHHHFVQPGRFDLGFCQCGLQHLRTQPGSGDILQRTKHGADGTALGADQINFAHTFFLPYSLFNSLLSSFIVAAASATMPRFATLKMGAPLSVLTATINSLSSMPAKC